MIGCYDFCGHYEWTFAWLKEQGGDVIVREFWRDAIGGESQSHAAELIREHGFRGMEQYWSHTLEEEAAGYTATRGEDRYRIDMHDCPSKGFLLDNDLEQFPDYCDHCLGWIGPVMEEAGFTVDHEHNHCGQCWWEMRRSGEQSPASEPGAVSGEKDVRLSPGWCPPGTKLDRFEKANSVEEKKPGSD